MFQGRGKDAYFYMKNIFTGRESAGQLVMRNSGMSWIRSFISVCCLLTITYQAQAGIVIGSTRVIYDGSKKEASLSVTNPEKDRPYLIQSWIDNLDASNTTKIPFIVTPPLFRLDAEQENTLRIVRAGGNLPQDRESVFWLSVKSIPATHKTDENQLQITVQSRIKLFYRPTGLLRNQAANAYKSLQFKRKGNQLEVVNPTPYYVSFYELNVGKSEIKEADMIAPKSSRSWPLPSGASGQISWQAITDYGGISAKETVSL